MSVRRAPWASGALLLISLACWATAFVPSLPRAARPSSTPSTPLPIRSRRPPLKTSVRLYGKVSQSEQGQKQDAGDAPLPLSESEIREVDKTLHVEPILDDDSPEAIERRIQELYEKGLYDPTPVKLSQQEIEQRRMMEQFLKDDEPKIEWTLDYFFAHFTNGKLKQASLGLIIKNFFLLTSISLLCMAFIAVTDEVLDPMFRDYKRWEGDELLRMPGDLGTWASTVPARVQDYLSHFSLGGYVEKKAVEFGGGRRWYQLFQ